MKKNSCVYCGNNPVPHGIYWFNESFNIFLTPIRQIILYNPLTKFLKKLKFDGKAAIFFLNIGEVLKIITRQSDSKKCKIRRAQVMWEDAEKRGIKMEELLMFGRPFDCYIASKSVTRDKRQEKQLMVFSGLPRPVGYTNKWLDLMDDKWLFKKLLMEKQLPVPAGKSVTSLREALKTFNIIDHPVIVKPRAGSRGRHSTTFVSSAEDLKRAFKVAKQLCHWVMVEEQLLGPVYRATVVNFELSGVLRGDSPVVMGDGAKTIEELIKQKNALSHSGVKNILIDKTTEVFLLRQNLTLSSVPQKGEKINLTEKIGVGYGGSSSEDFEICHPDNKELFVGAAKVLGDPIVGFDFIIADITKSWKQQKCGFIEVNSLPFINLHHDPLLGQPRNVAAKIWDMLGW